MACKLYPEGNAGITVKANSTVLLYHVPLLFAIYEERTNNNTIHPLIQNLIALIIKIFVYNTLHLS